MDSPRSAFITGARALLPVVPGVLPFALVSGVAAIGAGMSAAAAAGMSVIVYAGSAQLVASQLIGANTPALLIIATTLIVNLRFLVYSASLAPHLRQQRQPWRWLSAYLLTDQAYAVAISHFSQRPAAPHKLWYYLGGGLIMWLTWQAGTLAGMLLGAGLPASWQLDFAIPLTFIALAAPAVRGRPAAAAAAAAGVAAALSATLPFKLGLVVSVLAGVAAGLILEARAR